MNTLVVILMVVGAVIYFFLGGLTVKTVTCRRECPPGKIQWRAIGSGWYHNIPREVGDYHLPYLNGDMAVSAIWVFWPLVWLIILGLYVVTLFRRTVGRFVENVLNNDC